MNKSTNDELANILDQIVQSQTGHVCNRPCFDNMLLYCRLFSDTVQSPMGCSSWILLRRRRGAPAHRPFQHGSARKPNRAALRSGHFSEMIRGPVRSLLANQTQLNFEGSVNRLASAPSEDSEATHPRLQRRECVWHPVLSSPLKVQASSQTKPALLPFAEPAAKSKSVRKRPAAALGPGSSESWSLSCRAPASRLRPDPLV